MTLCSPSRPSTPGSSVAGSPPGKPRRPRRRPPLHQRLVPRPHAPAPPAAASPRSTIHRATPPTKIASVVAIDRYAPDRKRQRPHPQQLHCHHQRHPEQHQRPRQPPRQNAIDHRRHQPSLRRRCLLRPDPLDPLHLDRLRRTGCTDTCRPPPCSSRSRSGAHSCSPKAALPCGPRPLPFASARLVSSTWSRGNCPLSCTPVGSAPSVSGIGRGSRSKLSSPVFIRVQRRAKSKTPRRSRRS